MISLEQLQQLRGLVHKTVTRIQALELENSQLRQKLDQCENNLNGLLQEHRSLEKTQELVGVEVGELLSELEGLQLEVSTPKAEVAEENSEVALDFALPEVSPSDSIQFLETRVNVDPMQVSETDYESAQQSRGNAQEFAQNDAKQSFSPEFNADMPARQAVDSSTTAGFSSSPVSLATVVSQLATAAPLEQSLSETPAERENMSHSLDLSLGWDGSSLLELEDSLSSLSSPETSNNGDDDLGIF